MHGVADTHESEHNQKKVDVEALEPSHPAFEGFAKKVWALSGSLACATELVADVLRGRYSEEGPTSPQCFSPTRMLFQVHQFFFFFFNLRRDETN